MELRCWDPECVGNDLPAATVESGARVAPDCVFCGGSLARDGRVIAAGPLPVVEGRPVESFDELMDAPDERVVEVTAVPAGEDQVLTCALTDGGVVVAAAVHDRESGREVEHLMELLAGTR